MYGNVTAGFGVFLVLCVPGFTCSCFDTFLVLAALVLVAGVQARQGAECALLLQKRYVGFPFWAGAGIGVSL